MGGFIKAFGGIFGTLCAAALILSGPYLYWYDRTPAATPLLHYDWWFVHVHWPSNPSAKSAKAAALASWNYKQWSACHANEGALEASVAAQDAAVARLAADGRRRQAQAQQAVDDAQAGVAAADRRAAQIMSARPAGATECVQAEALIRGVVR